MGQKTQGGEMVKKTVTTIILSLLPLIAQEDFLKGVKVQDLMLDRIVAPSVRDTIGINDWSKFFFNSENRSVSPNGKLIAEARTKSGYVDGIWIFNTETGEEQQIDDRGLLPKWSPDGQKIAFLKQKVRVGEYLHGHQLYGEDELWICESNGENKKKLTSNTHVIEFLWNPDGAFICYGGLDSTSRLDEPYYVGLVNITTSERRFIDTGLPYNSIHFSLSPNGEMIAYCKPLKEKLMTEWWVTDAEVFIANIDGSGKTQITDTEAVETMVKWSEDGKSLIIEQYGPTPDDFSFPPYVKIILKKK